VKLVIQKPLAEIHFFAPKEFVFNVRVIPTAGATNFVLKMFVLSPVAIMPEICVLTIVIVRAEQNVVQGKYAKRWGDLKKLLTYRVKIREIVPMDFFVVLPVVVLNAMIIKIV
jgi:hypothetical protein